MTCSCTCCLSCELGSRVAGVGNKHKRRVAHTKTQPQDAQASTDSRERVAHTPNSGAVHPSAARRGTRPTCEGSLPPDEALAHAAEGRLEDRRVSLGRLCTGVTCMEASLHTSKGVKRFQAQRPRALPNLPALWTGALSWSLILGYTLVHRYPLAPVVGKPAAAPLAAALPRLEPDPFHTDLD